MPVSLNETEHIYIYIYPQLRNVLKMKYYTNGSCYCKRMVEELNVDSLQNLVSFILLRP
jgi:hypothetical protein